MELHQCIYCDKALPEKGFFCPNCTKQIRCKECKETLEVDANACIYCGSLVTTKIESAPFNNGSPVMNVIEYHETRSTRSLKASLTNSVGNSLSGALGQIMAKGMQTKNIQSKFDKNGLVEDTFAEILQEDINQQDQVALPQPNNPTLEIKTNTDLDQIKRVFRFEDEKTALIETRLKATSKLDYARRVIVLYLYGHRLLGRDFMPRSEVNKILKAVGLEDGNTRRWIANNHLVRLNNDDNSLEIIIPGVEQAQLYLTEITNPEIDNKWAITTQPKHRKKNNKQQEIEEEN